jgi:hypothetical protein
MRQWHSAFDGDERTYALPRQGFGSLGEFVGDGMCFPREAGEGTVASNADKGLSQFGLQDYQQS